MVILTVLSAYTDQGLPLPGLNANDSYLRLQSVRVTAAALSGNLNRLVIVLSIPYVFPYCLPY